SGGWDMKKKTVFLTGGTGTMGWAAFQELNKLADRVNIKLLARRSRRNEELLAPYIAKPHVKVVWGDFLDDKAILEGVTGCDYVLHIGGMVSPAADWKPYTTHKVNIGAAKNIAKAVLAQPNADDIKVAYIGSVAQTGDRNQPIHWGRCGDPIKISIYDHYAISKTIAEQVIVESGIKHWVSLRQSGILHPDILGLDPIMFHVPINGVLEWCTVEDAGRLMAHLVDYDLPEDFWCRFYNIGSGREYRITNYEFEQLLMDALGLPAPEKLFDPSWFVLKNFHGHFYADGDKLEEYLRFRENLPIQDYFKRLADRAPGYFAMAKLVHNALIGPVAKPFMKKFASVPGFGTLDWIKNRDQARISAFYGTYEDWQSIGTWDTFQVKIPDKDIRAATYLDHGYDESKPHSELGLDDMKKAAAFRGGECLSTSMNPGDMAGKLRWKCQFGHTFQASPSLVLLGGHWCPQCLPVKRWNYDEIAKGNPFFAQVWYPNHTREEHNVYEFDALFKGWEEIKQ
ncbi:MAG: NAD(P)-dependent oxidoreductase, partial [Clostridiales bacterium]|nr:NAD(P)-dependent oxidoreductase [Clostridiales bacterium]